MLNSVERKVFEAEVAETFPGFKTWVEWDSAEKSKVSETVYVPFHVGNQRYLADVGFGPLGLEWIY